MIDLWGGRSGHLIDWLQKALYTNNRQLCHTSTTTAAKVFTACNSQVDSMDPTISQRPGRETRRGQQGPIHLKSHFVPEMEAAISCRLGIYASTCPDGATMGFASM